MSRGPDSAARRDLHAAVLLLAGGALLRIAVTGSYTSYVKAGARPYLYAAGIAVTALALVSLWQAVAARLRRRAAETAGHTDHHDGDGHDHHHGRFDVAWLLVAPLAVLLMIAPKPAGAYEAGRAGSALPPAPSSPYGPLPAGDPVTLSVVDYASRAVFDAGHTLSGRHVQLTGFLTAAPGGGWYLTRMLVTCCAADAQPIKVGLAGDVPGAHADAWVTVVGDYTTRTATDTVNGATIPFLTVVSAQPTTQPANPYES
jgi:uncharacterized repeat protein (TIGR03943 family)